MDVKPNTLDRRQIAPETVFREIEIQNILSVLSLVGQLGFIIGVPAAFFAFGGAVLDRHFHTSPLFVFVGLGVAITASSVWVYRFIQRIKLN